MYVSLNHKNQQGVVLITGLIFLLVISMAGFSTLKNLALFSKNHAGEIKQQKSRHHFNLALMLIHKKISAQNYTLDEFTLFAAEQKLVLGAGASQVKKINELLLNPAYFQREAGFDYCLEYIGSREKTNEQAQTISSWIVRLHVIEQGAQDYALVNWLEIIPQQSGASYQVNDLGWTEYWADEA